MTLDKNNKLLIEKSLPLLHIIFKNYFIERLKNSETGVMRYDALIGNDSDRRSLFCSCSLDALIDELKLNTHKGIKQALDLMHDVSRII